MCFDEIPVEFDENGDPYLAEEADEVELPDPDEEAGIDEDPRAAYEAIVESLPDRDVAERDPVDPDAPTAESD